MDSDVNKRHLNKTAVSLIVRIGYIFAINLLLLVSLGALHNAWAQGPSKCTINRPDSIDFHEEGTEGDKVLIVCVDLTDPHIRFETVMAQDFLDVNPRPNPYVRERVEDMVSREPYSNRNPIVAFNADYFGDGPENIHGPEGPTMKNGHRIDGPNSTDDLQNDKSLRVALSVSRLNQIDLGKKSNDELDTISIHRTKLFNTVGGGPTLIKDGEVFPEPCDIKHNENVTDYNCSDTKQTAVGITQDQQTFIVVVAESRSGQEMGEILLHYGAYSAIKLDGGDSSQLWYRGELKKPGGRPIANAILIFRDIAPQHNARVIFRSEYPIVERGETITLTFALQNTGFLSWEHDLPYGLTHTGGENFGLATWQPLAWQPQSDPVQSFGDPITWTLPVVAPHEPGAYQTRWQMAYRTDDMIEVIESEVGFIVTVLHEERSFGLIDAIRQIIDQARQEAEQTLEEYLNDLERQIDERIQEEEDRFQNKFERFIRNLLPDWIESCLLGPGAIIFMVTVLRWRRKARTK